MTRFCLAEAESGLHPNGKVVTGIDIPDGCIFKNHTLPNAHVFHALTDCQSMGDLKVSVFKGKDRYYTPGHRVFIFAR